MNQHIDWDELWVCDNEEQEGSDLKDSNSSYQLPTSDSDEMGSDSEAENLDNISIELSEKVHKVLDYINSLGMNLPLFLDTLSWGDQGCIQDEKICKAFKGEMIIIFLFFSGTSRGSKNGVIFPAPVPAMTTQLRPRRNALDTSNCQG